MHRRALVLGAPVILAACVSGRDPTTTVVEPTITNSDPRYSALTSERFPVPAIDTRAMNPELLRQIVSFRTSEPVGTVIVDPRSRFLFLIQEGGAALRYGVGVGREGLEWSGRAIVGRKAKWPRWTPTANMIAREPERNARWAGGMPAGLDNPLGARALYLYRDGVDTLYRLHGTNEPWSIGQAVSSGCIRLLNQDIIDLHSRVPTGSGVIVLPFEAGVA